MVVVEWQLATEQDVHDDSGTPDVNLWSRVQSGVKRQQMRVSENGHTYFPEMTSGAA